jgi:EF-P beta-lysylation protein EpmB
MHTTALKLIDSDLPEKWQEILSDLITDPKELLQFLELDETKLALGSDALDQFSLKVPRPFARRMRKGDWNDPLLRQVWPDLLEELSGPGNSFDPLSERDFNPIQGLLHKYHGRALLTVAPHCAVHCRYCFRRHFNYGDNSPSREEWGNVLKYLAEDASIEEAIFSGGDPLALSDRQLAWLIDQVSGISHISTLRIHTRLPIVIPQRVTDKLIQILTESRLKVVIVVHCNHSQELDKETKAGLSTLAANSIIMLNQSVILKEVNDTSQILIELSRALFSCDVLPYYLHLPDRVSGTAHFQVSKSHALEVLGGVRRRLPGYLVPTLVQEEAGNSSKTRLG